MDEKEAAVTLSAHDRAVYQDEIKALRKTVDKLESLILDSKKLLRDTWKPDLKVYLKDNIMDLIQELKDSKDSCQELASENEELKYLLEKAAGALKGV